ncbi:hypothetical protein [Streptomyces sp. ERV7]|nr:hypothetical protein [Streptomyces sp. ERV7]
MDANPPEGGEKRYRKAVMKVLGWLTLQGLSALIRYLTDDHS